MHGDAKDKSSGYGARRSLGCLINMISRKPPEVVRRVDSIVFDVDVRMRGEEITGIIVLAIKLVVDLGTFVPCLQTRRHFDHRSAALHSFVQDIETEIGILSNFKSKRHHTSSPYNNDDRLLRQKQLVLNALVCACDRREVVIQDEFDCRSRPYGFETAHQQKIARLRTVYAVHPRLYIALFEDRIRSVLGGNNLRPWYSKSPRVLFLVFRLALPSLGLSALELRPENERQRPSSSDRFCARSL